MTDQHPPVFPPLRVAVVGLGPMGQNHVQAWQRVGGAQLTTVVDTHADRIADVMRQTGCASAETSDALIGMVDAVSVATPAETHDQVAIPLLRAGVHCLIEKPLATTPEGCVAIAAAAAAGNAVVQVGHIERFNPAVAALFDHLGPSASTRQIIARRLNPPSGRAFATDVVSDLMSHDLDIVLALKETHPVIVTARRSGPEDATAILSFADGSTATLSADRAAETRVRDLIVATDRQKLSVDYAARRFAIDGVTQSVDDRSDALTRQLTAFVTACRERGDIRVGVSAASDVMKVVWQIHKALGDTA